MSELIRTQSHSSRCQRTAHSTDDFFGLVFRKLCPHSEQFSFLGDSMQAIFSSTFRFDDLKAVVYRLEQNAGQIPSMPRIFQLSTNYRSHKVSTAYPPPRRLTDAP